MSNLEGMSVFVWFFVSSRLFGDSVKILVQVIQFPVKVRDFLPGRLAGLLQGRFFLAERIVVAAELFNVEVFWIDTEAFQHIFRAVMEQEFRFVLA